MGKLLTLAMSEMSPKSDKYKVIAYYLDIGEIIEIDLSETKFKDINGRIVWDIGAVTKVEDIIKDRNEVYEIKGDMVLERYYSKSEFKDVFLNELSNYSTFIRNKDIQYAIIKPSTVILKNPKMDKQNCFRSYITFWANGVEGKCKYNKDYRWLKYWNHIYDSNALKIEEKISHYEMFFKNKEVYLILYRYKGKDNSKGKNNLSRRYTYTSDIHWVAGFHYF